MREKYLICTLKKHLNESMIPVIWINNSVSIFELPLSSTHWTELLHLLRVEPFQYAMHMEHMGAFPPNQRAIVPWYFAIWATAIKLHSANPTRLVISHPVPSSYGHPTF